MTVQHSSIIVGVRNPEHRADLEIAASACALARRLGTPVHLIHVITPAEVRSADAETRLERADERLRASRVELWRMARALIGAGSPRFRILVDVRVAGTAHEGLCEAANEHAAASIFVGPGTTSVALIEIAPCNVVVARPKMTPDVPEPLIEPPLEPGEHVRETDARSEAHVVRPGWTHRHYHSVTNEMGVSRW